MSNLDWVALPVALIAYFYEFSISARWTDARARMKFEGWRKLLGGFLAFPGWAFQPLLSVMQALAAVAVFLFWRNNFTSSSTINFDLVMGFTVANVVFLKMWTPSMLWGPNWWWLAAVDSFFVMATSLDVLVVMGIESAWLPFGLYVIYPVLAFIIMLVSLYFWWNGEAVVEGLQKYGHAVEYLNLGKGINEKRRTRQPRRTSRPIRYQ